MTDHPHVAPRVGRRGFLLGLGAAAVLGNTRLALAQAPGEQRFVVVLLRGALDGLAAVPPYGDPALAGLRGGLAPIEPGREGGVLDLGGSFGLHPRLANLHASYAAGEALVLHAVAGPWRSRSHFEAQDLLESGGTDRMSSGWLNRALTALPARAGAQRNGIAVGVDVPLLMRGPAPVANYAPAGFGAAMPDLLARVSELSARDPVLGPVLREGLAARGFAVETVGTGRPGPGGGGPRRNAFAILAAAGGRLLAERNGPRVAALETTGWDTHAAQAARLAPPLSALDEGLLELKTALGENWRRTAVLVITEFGRTVRVNGTDGTDHGTGGVAFLLGGAVAGGRVRADWPGLGPDRLFQGRDLQPTTDLRSVAKALLRDHLRLPPQAVAQAFPGSEGVAPMAGLLRA